MNHVVAYWLCIDLEVGRMWVQILARVNIFLMFYYFGQVAK